MEALEATTIKIYEEDLKVIKDKITSKSNNAERVHEYVRKCEGIIENDKPPSFLLSSKATNEQIFDYLKQNPKSAQFLYKKYSDNRGIIEEFCDPSNPLFIPEVAEELKISVQVRNLEGELAELKRSIDNKINERNSLIDGIAELDKEYNEIEGKLKKTKLDLEISETAIANLHGKEGLEKVKGFISQVQAFVNDTYSNPDNKMPHNLVGSFATFSIDKGRFGDLKTDAEKLSMYLETDRFRLEDIENSKTELAKQLEDIEKQKEQAKLELNVVQYMKPTKKLEKVARGMGDMSQFLDNIEVRSPSKSEIFVPLIGYNGLRENIQDAYGTIADLIRQIKNKGGETDAV